MSFADVIDQKKLQMDLLAWWGYVQDRLQP